MHKRRKDADAPRFAEIFTDFVGAIEERFAEGTKSFDTRTCTSWGDTMTLVHAISLTYRPNG